MEISYQRCKELASDYDLPLTTMLVYAEIVQTYTPGQVLPKRSISNLAEHTGLSRITVRKYIKQLVTSGLLEDRDGYLCPVPEETARINYPSSLFHTPELGGLDMRVDGEYTFPSYFPSTIKYVNTISDHTINYSATIQDHLSKSISTLKNVNSTISLCEETSQGTVTSPDATKSVPDPKESVPDPTESINDPKESVPDPTFDSTITVLSSSDPDLPLGTVLNDDPLVRYQTEQYEKKVASRTIKKNPTALSLVKPTSVRSEPLQDATGVSYDNLPQLPWYCGYTWPDLLRSPIPLERAERILSLGREHMRVRFRYAQALDSMPAYFRGDIEHDPLDTMEYTPYSSLADFLESENPTKHVPSTHALTNPHAGKGKELLARWKARKNRSVTLDQFLEFILMGDTPKPDEDSPSYYHWHEVFLSRKRSL